MRFHLGKRREALKAAAKKAKAKGGACGPPFSEAEVCYFGACVTLGLEALHAQSIVLRDLKPDNLLLNLGGQLKIVDLGLAAVLREGASATSKTGTRGYWPPEMVRRPTQRPPLMSAGDRR